MLGFEAYVHRTLAEKKKYAKFLFYFWLCKLYKKKNKLIQCKRYVSVS